MPLCLPPTAIAVFLPFFFCPKVKLLWLSRLCLLGFHSSLSKFCFLFLFFHFISSIDHKLFIYLYILKTRSICFDRCLFWGSGQSSAWFSGLSRKTCGLYFGRTNKNCSFGTLVNNYLSSKRCNCWTCFGWGGERRTLISAWNAALAYLLVWLL